MYPYSHKIVIFVFDYFSFDSTDGLFSQSSTSYFFEKQGSGYVIKRMQTNGGVVAQLFETEGVSHFSWVNITSVLVDQKSSGGDISGGSATTDDLSFSFDDKDYKWNLDRDLKAKEPFFSTGEYFSDNQAETKEALKNVLKLQKQILHSLDNSAEGVQKSHQVCVINFSVKKVNDYLFLLTNFSLASIIFICIFLLWTTTA